MNITDTRNASPIASTSDAVGSRRSRSNQARPAIGVALVAVFAGVTGWLTPRGPITSAEAIVSMVVALGVGCALGAIVSSRWWFIVGPTLYVIVFELVRLGVEGPTVDVIRLSSTYGVIAFAVGRVVHGVIVLAPLALGTAIGRGFTGRAEGPTWGGLAWSVVSALALVMLALMVGIALPASTAPIVGADGHALEGSIAELTTVQIGGHEQAVMIRGRDVDNPVLLYLAGGPGGTDLGAMRLDTSLEADFVVVTWDQRGTGKSYAALDPIETLTLDQMVADTIELTEYLADRFTQNHIYLAGNSWGSFLGAIAVSERPDLFEAFVGIGQMVDPRQTDIMFWEDALEWADSSGETGLADTLRRNGPPPYDDLLSYEAAVGSEHRWNEYPGLDTGNEMPAILFVPEYDLMDKINGFRGFLDTFSVLYPQLQDIDLRSQIHDLPIPVYMVTGEYEARGRAVLAEEWFQALNAPVKASVVVESAGHRAHFDQPAVFADFMRDIVMQPTP